MEKAKQIAAFIGPGSRFPGQKALICGIVIMAECLALKEPEDILVTKDLYPRIAHELGCSVSAAEKQIYSAVNSCWMDGSNDALTLLSGKRLTHRPKALQLLIYCAHFYLYEMPYHLSPVTAFSVI